MLTNLAGYVPVLLFAVFFSLAIGSAISLLVQRNPIYSAVSLVGVFVALAGLYIMLAAPFIAAVQIIVYAGAIMVLVVFVIMLLNVETEERRPLRLRFLVPTAAALAAVLVAEAAFVIFYVQDPAFAPLNPNAAGNASNTGLTDSIGTGLFTIYLLPFEITSILILMALVGAITLARRVSAVGPTALIVPGALSLPMNVIDPRRVGDATEVITNSTAEAARALGLSNAPRARGGE